MIPDLSRRPEQSAAQDSRRLDRRRPHGWKERVEGGAQSEADVPQLAKRMQASVYFDQVTSPSSQRVDDRQTNIVYYKFTITGKVVF